MFGTIRRHQAWLWWIIAGITIISFVILGPSGCNELKLSGIGGGARYGTIGDHAITLDELQNAQKEVTLRYLLMTGHLPDAKSDYNVNREAYSRLFLIEKEKQFGVQIAPDTLAEYARQHWFGNASLDTLLNQYLKPANFDENDLERFLTHEFGLQQLAAVAGLNGLLVTPGEAETLYRQEHQELACSMILLSVSNYLPSVSVTNPAVLQFYTNRMAIYREPARMEVNYVKFNVTNYWAETVKAMSNLDAAVDMQVKKAGTNLFGHAKTPEESRAAIKDYLIRTNAINLARRDAGKFADELDGMQPKKLENIETLAKQKGLTVQVTEPFDDVQGPTNLDVFYNFAQTAFKLTPDDPFSGSIMEEDGVYVIGFKKLIPASIPPFNEVSAKVLEDFRLVQGAVMVQQVVTNAYHQLTNGLAQGKTFTVLAAQLGLKTESLPPFSLSTTKLPDTLEERVSLKALRQAAFSTGIGSVSWPARAEHGAFLLYVEKKLPVDEAKMKTELPGFLAGMRQGRLGDAFNQWVNRQMQQDPAFFAAWQQASQEGAPRSTTRRPK
jgi:hypothetical protein